MTDKGPSQAPCGFVYYKDQCIKDRFASSDSDAPEGK